jgi:DNA gyrase subunit B
MAKKPLQAPAYDASSIQVLEGLDPVRKRPGMYIGGTGVDGLHHLIWEVVNNSVDEAMAGHCRNIVVRMKSGNWIEVTDDGRGIPVEKHPKTGKSTLETILTVLHAGGKFGGGGYKISGGLHGVGASVVNALSTDLIATVERDGKVWVQSFKRGDSQGDVKAVGKSKTTGTTIAFTPDPQIFPEILWDYGTILDYLRNQAFLTKGLRITLEDLREVGDKGEDAHKARRHGFYFDTGIVSFVRFLNRGRKVQNAMPVAAERQVGDTNVEFAFQYTDRFTENLYAFANNILNPGGGTHVTGFKMALTRVLNDYAKKNNLIKEKEGGFTTEDLKEGLTAVVSVKIPNPQFEGQTKDKLNNVEVRGVVQSAVAEALEEYLETHPTDARQIIDKCLLTVRARIAARAAKDAVIRKGALEGLTLPGKLADCSSKDKESTELYIVEGDSAGGSAKQGRNREFQAILPLRGKLVNVEKTSIDKVVKSDTLKPIIIALGTGIGETFDASRLRYGRIIIMADADVDGSHIRTLLLTFFYRYFNELVRNGNIYIAQPPLYQLKRGKDIRYAYTEEEKLKSLVEMQAAIDAKKSAAKAKKGATKENTGVTALEILNEIGKDSGPVDPNNLGAVDGTQTVGGVNIQRYKGLGEMNPEQLWDTTMNPETRMMLQVHIEDAEAADRMFDVLMGSEVEPRRRFIQTHARQVKNLDV